MNQKQFKYGKHHFIPYRKFNDSDGDYYAKTHRLKSDWELGYMSHDYNGRQKFKYSYDEFYEASSEKLCDIFMCVENQKLYVPCAYELQEYIVD